MSSGHVHPHVLATAPSPPPGMALPAFGPVESKRHHTTDLRNALDIMGGVSFAFLIGIICMRVGSMIFTGGNWAAAIGWESVWLVAAIACAPLMPSGIRHDISWRSTWLGLRLDWPELVYATWVLGIYTAFLGGIRLDLGPIGLALAVGTAEEFIFRVLLLGWLVTRVSAPAALVISSVAFGAAHLHELSIVGLLSVVPQTAGGFVLGAAYLRSRNPIGPILAHAFWDFPYFMALGIGVSGGSTEAGAPTVLGLMPWIAFMIYGLWLVRPEVSMVGRVDPVGCSCVTCVQHR